MQGAVSSASIHRPGFGSWLLSNVLGIIVGVVASLPPTALYWVLVDAYIENSGGDALTFGTAFICGLLNLVAVFAGWLVYAGVVHSRMSEWANRNVIVTVVGVQGLVLSLVAVNGVVSLISLGVALLLLPVIFMQVRDRDPGRVTVLIIAGLLAAAAIAGPIIALESELRPL
jgi:hypothetical protein